jgi:hypothetical protein
LQREQAMRRLFGRMEALELTFAAEERQADSRVFR